MTNVVCFRSLPDPLGIVLWRYKSEFIEFPVIASQFAFLVWQSPGYKYHFLWKIPENGRIE